MSTGCPNVIVLTRFASGVLDEHIAHEVSQHLDQCEKCQTRTDDLVRETDSLVLAIRAGNAEPEDPPPILGDFPFELDIEKPPERRRTNARPLELKAPDRQTHPKGADSTFSDDDQLEWESERDESQLNRLISGVKDLAPKVKSSMLPEPSRRPLRKADFDQFVTALRRSTLLEEERVEELLRATRAETTEAFAQELIDQDVLTPYQARVLSRGRWKGLVLGNYEILEKLGQGGMGQVYRAQHRRMGRIVCLKVLRSSGRRSADTVERFRREIKTISSLDHPHFVIAHDADEADGIQFLVMEFIEGRDLAQLIHEDGPMRWKDTLRVILQVADAIDYAHSEGVIH
nr:serine/threonine protein kinase [Planctomycetota bacterium]